MPGSTARRTVADVPINDVAKKFEKRRDELGFAPGEQVLAGCMTNPKAAVGLAVGGLVGAAVQAAVEKRSQGDPGTGLAAAWPQRGRQLMAITTERVVVASMSAWSGRPKDVVAQWSNAEITAFDVERKATSYPFAITFADGSVAASEGGKGTGADGLADAAARLWPRAATPPPAAPPSGPPLAPPAAN